MTPKIAWAAYFFGISNNYDMRLFQEQLPSKDRKPVVCLNVAEGNNVPESVGTIIYI